MDAKKILSVPSLSYSSSFSSLAHLHADCLLCRISDRLASFGRETKVERDNRLGDTEHVVTFRFIAEIQCCLRPSLIESFKHLRGGFGFSLWLSGGYRRCNTCNLAASSSPTDCQLHSTGSQTQESPAAALPDCCAAGTCCGGCCCCWCQCSACSL